MIEVLTLVKTYNVPDYSTKKALMFILEKELRDLDIKILEINFDEDKLALVKIEGEDEKIAKHYLHRNYGTKRSIADINCGDILFGRLLETDQVNFGLFVDVGATTTTADIDALYPLYELRKQLALDNIVPLRKIVRAYGLIENLPLFFEVTERKVLGTKLRIKLSTDALNWLIDPLVKGKETLTITGTSTRMIKEALEQTRHSQDIEVIERIGILEHRLICKEGTRADGLIPEIGHLIKGAKIGAQIPFRVEDMLEEAEDKNG